MPFAVGTFGKRFIHRFQVKWDETSERRNCHREQKESNAKLQKATVGTYKGTLRKSWVQTCHAVKFAGLVYLLMVSAVVWVRGLPNTVQTSTPDHLQTHTGRSRDEAFVLADVPIRCPSTTAKIPAIHRPKALSIPPPNRSIQAHGIKPTIPARAIDAS
jgi:hypothetical protein